jgi:N-ethylmaleimide reductase
MSATATKKILTPLQLGSLTLRNRVVLPPLTRNRAAAGDVPSDLAVTYYEQRASAGLVISEASQISNHGKGYPSTPGNYSDAQVEGWKKVVSTVHAKGAPMFLQLWHCGRLTHSSYHPEAGAPLGPSAVAASGKTLSASFKMVPHEVPREATQADINAVVEAYQRGARNAKRAGFDGIELHAANGYLLDQFLHDKTNRRTDAYGGSFANRMRLLHEVLDAVTAVYPLERVGVRISPFSNFGDIADTDSKGLFTHVVGQLSTRRIGYLHVIEPRWLGKTEHDNALYFRKLFAGTYIAAGGFTPETAEAAVREDKADAVSFGRWFIANPDLPARIARDAPLNKYDRNTFYSGGAKGYTDYPALP